MQHSEFNTPSVERGHFLQTWLMPNVTGIPLPFFRYSSPLGRWQAVSSYQRATEYMPDYGYDYAVYPRNRHLPKKARAVINHLVAAFKMRAALGT